MHMISKKDLNSGEMDTLTKSCSPTIVITATGEVQTHEEATVYVMEGHAKKCVERYCELANNTTQQLYKVSTPCIDDHHFKEEEMKSVGDLSQVCSQFFFVKCLYLARIGRPDILWSVKKLARSITK